ncbi:MAG: MtrB/PioB family decaheme-associated outer membrane protein [Acidobacteria bacterium]|nr:MtrB/PioB family decaheme-associated outer membrane protein [Acidobacteriota bacterium]
MKRAFGLVLREWLLVTVMVAASYGQSAGSPWGGVSNETGVVLPAVKGPAEQVAAGGTTHANTGGVTISGLPDLQKLWTLPLNARGIENFTLLQISIDTECARTGCLDASMPGGKLPSINRVAAPNKDLCFCGSTNIVDAPDQPPGVRKARDEVSAKKSAGVNNPQNLLPPQAREKKQILLFKFGEVQLGGRAFLERPSEKNRGKFEEYRDIPPGLFVEGLHFQLEGKEGRYFTELRARQPREADQNYLFRVSGLGLYEGRFEWNQIPHVFSNTGRSLYKQTRPGVFELDPAVRSAIQAARTGVAVAPLLDRFLAGAPDVDLKGGWNIGRFLMKHTPTPNWDLQYEYTRTRKEGERPIGALTGFANELLEPIEQTIHDLQLSAGLARERGQLQFSYNLSLFRNDLDTLVWDQYLRRDDNADLGPARGRHALAPSNSAHVGSITGALNLPWRSRLTSTFSYGLGFQNDRFIPPTINSAISNSPALVLPAESLRGDVHTRLLNLQFTIHPLRNVSMKARYRLYDFDDRTPNLTFPGWVSTDSVLRTEAIDRVTSSRFSYTKHNAGTEVGWRPLLPLSVKVGYEWERWNRDQRQREVPVSDEQTPRVSVEYTPFDWLALRASYARSWRRISAYNTFAHLASAVTAAEFARLVPNGTAQSPLIRQYDLADRDRDRADLLPQFTFFQTVTFTPTLSLRKDNYKNSPFGLQKSKNWAAGVDVSWSPIEGGALFFASYMHEQFFAQQRSRYRPFLPDFTLRIDNPTYDWVGRNEDFVDTFRIGMDTPLISEKLDLHLVWNYSQAIGEMHASNPVTPKGGAVFENADAKAADFPDIKDSLHPLEASLRYRFSKGYFVKLGYVFEQFHITDFRTDDIQPYMGDVDPLIAQRAVYLGAQIRPYTARMLAMTIGYRF